MPTLEEKFIDTFTIGDNEDKRNAVFNTGGPTLIIAGPGTGKTYILVLRTLYLILSGKAKPSEIVLTTFTEKSAFELRDRLSSFAKKLEEELDLHELVTGTIHSICDRFNSEFLKHTPLKKNYIVLDDLTRPLFIYDHFNEIISPFKIGDKYFGKWESKWYTIGCIQTFFDKITEELIDPTLLVDSDFTINFLDCLGRSYIVYKEQLINNNRVDFAFQQRIFYDLLRNEDIRAKITPNIKYLLVDEYQDTNYIQEQIAFNLVKPHNNLTVVGDEDQALYRFRGATVRNILEFASNFGDCKVFRLLENFRSHKKIITCYNNFIDQTDWSNLLGDYQFRYPGKYVVPAKSTVSPEYPAVFSIQAADPKEEADRFADMVDYFLKNKIIDDPSDVALLLRSVKLEYSGRFINALEEKGIKSFCPRARRYFENDEILMVIACYALIFGFVGRDIDGYIHKDKVMKGIELLYKDASSPLISFIKSMRDKIDKLSNANSIDEIPTDILYRMFAFAPFMDFIDDENSARNLSRFSALMSSFMTYYHMNIITGKNKTALKYRLFNSFFYFLLDEGQNEYEDESDPIPRGYVQIMTIHQSKGLEFPVVVVGSLEKRKSGANKQIDQYLSSYYRKPLFEPQYRISDFDHARLFYVAFSRPQKILVLSSGGKPNSLFAPLIDGLDQWPDVKRKTLNGKKFRSKDPYKPKKTLSLTSHINVYDTCPRQYKFYKEYEFTPSRTGQMLFGTLVHETIEDIHRHTLDHEKVDEIVIHRDFEDNYKGLLAGGHRPLAEKPKAAALSQVINYFDKNRDILERVVETEVDVSYEKDDYIINGKIDLLLGKDEKLEILDFKSQPMPDLTDQIILKYRYQLHVYAHIIKERYKKDPERLYLYWTAEEKRETALMEIDYDEKLVEEARRHFDATARCILMKDFSVKTVPNKKKVCYDCDFQYYCGKDILK